MDLRTFATSIFLIAWATLGGIPSGIVMGLFFLVYQDGHRKGVLPPQGDRTLTELFAAQTPGPLTARFSRSNR